MITYSDGWQALYQTMKDTLSFTSEDQAKDAVARLAGQKANPQFVDSERLMGADYDVMTRLGREAARGVSFIGVIWEGLQSSLAMAPLLNGLPMAQALVLMAVYMFLPIVTLFSGYDLRMMFTGAIAIFSIKFCSVLWAIATWVDARLINAMYPGLSGNIIIQDITHAAYGVDTGMAYKRVLLNILLMLMFIGLPMIWLGMMGWIGANISSSVGRLMDSAGGKLSAAGQGGAKAIKGVATKGRG
jgi:hypothetical protein